MAVTTTKTNKPINPRGNDQSPKGYNRAELYTGKALDFDGVNDYVDLDGFTMAGNVATICFYAQFDNDGYLLDLNPNRLVIKNHNTQGFQVYNNNAWTVYDTTDMTTMGFYVIVSDGTTQRAYYNGHQLSGDKTITAIDFSAITEFKLGSYHQTGSPWYNGKIAGFKIFNTALTAAQVSDLYNNPEKIVPTGVADTALKLWLPMMEGAGTTAYDGSGNGNHGTINGATWTHGVGSPVAQSAVIDWNKGSNLLQESENYTGSKYLKQGATLTTGQTDPLGGNNAVKVQLAAGANNYLYQSQGSGERIVSAWIKGETAQDIGFSFGGVTSNTISLTTEWQRFSFTASDSGGGIFFGNYFGPTPAQEAKTFYVWGSQLETGSTLGAYVENPASTSLTSEVLLPQGLTTGRDITGVNLFENVRKQGALNLDGNSWAEVHDNASLDFGTGSFTLEAWAKVKYVAQGSSYNVIMSMGLNISNPYSVGMLVNQQLEPIFIYNNTGTAESARTEGEWVHIVGTYDETNATIYVNGVQKDQDVRTTVDTSNPWVKHIGRDTTSVRFYNDQIAQPRIYNRALTAEEVERNYNAGKNIYK